MDPILRELAAETPGVELLPGETVTAADAGGVETSDRAGGRRRVGARLVVAADGRDSRTARMVNVPGRVRPHGRFFYWAYYEGLPLVTGDTAQMWIRDPDGAYAFPMEDGITLFLAGPHKRRLPEFRADLEGAYERYLTGLPDGPDPRSGTRVPKLIGKLDMPNVVRPAAARGVAFVGDAAMAADPFWGVGCGWPFQSSEWLVDATAAALTEGGDLDAALRRYGRRHARMLLGHYLSICDFATGRPVNFLERGLFRAAARDSKVAHAFEQVGARRRMPWSLLSPMLAARIARVAAA